MLRAPQFWAIALTHFACCAAHSGPIFHMVTHAIDQGVIPMVAATVLGVSGLSSIAGRIGSCLLADRFGAKRTLVAGLALQAAMVFSYLFTREAWSFFVAAVVLKVRLADVCPAASAVPVAVTSGGRPSTVRAIGCLNPPTASTLIGGVRVARGGCGGMS